MVVTVAYDGDDDDQETFLLGSREEGVARVAAGVLAAVAARVSHPRRQPGASPASTSCPTAGRRRSA